MPSSALRRLLVLVVMHPARSFLRARTTMAIDEARQPFRGAQPPEALPEIFLPSALPEEDERLWVPQTESVSFRPLCLSVSGGYYVNLLRVRGAGLLSRHRHPGPVHGHVLKGRWRYLEHDWVAEAGSYVFEPPGETHTLVVPEGCDEMITLFHVTGALLYCDPATGAVTGFDDVNCPEDQGDSVIRDP